MKLKQLQEARYHNHYQALLGKVEAAAKRNEWMEEETNLSFEQAIKLFTDHYQRPPDEDLSGTVMWETNKRDTYQYVSVMIHDGKDGALIEVEPG